MGRRKPVGWIADPGPGDIKDCIVHLREKHRCAVYLKATFDTGAAGWYGHYYAIAYCNRGGDVLAQREVVRFDLEGAPRLTVLMWRVLWNLCQRVEAEGFVVMSSAQFAEIILP